jgi:signal transduction histidine kinase
MAHGPVPRQRRHHEDLTEEVAALCHDLRQCVTAGLLLTELPSESHLDTETRRRFDLIHQTLTHAGALLEQVTVDERPQHWLLDLTDLAEQCADVAEFRHKVRVVNETADPAIVSGDPLLLHRAIDNMIDNAGRAAGAYGDVVVRVGAADDEAWVEVSDDGPGFGRIEHGTGQGLSVVSAAAHDCDGRLEIKSGPGPGTSVRVTLPRAHARPAPADGR